jgi:ribose-phosphate pyrophosphokinase
MRTVLLSGSAHHALGQAIAEAVGQPLSALRLERFPDGEVDVTLNDDVRGAQVFVVQALQAPVGEHLLELCLLSDACHRAGAASVTAVVPYLGYARQDRRERGTEALGARVMAELLSAGRIDRLICLDVHSRAVEGCFLQPVEHVTLVPAMVEAIRPTLSVPAVVVSPDLGAVKRAEAFARPLGLPVAVVHKQRLAGDEVAARGVVGDVKGKKAIVVDDMISTGGTIAASVQAVLEAGAQGPVTVCAVHGLLVGPAADRLLGLPVDMLLVSDSVPPPPAAKQLPVRIVSSASALAQAINRLRR